MQPIISVFGAGFSFYSYTTMRWFQKEHVLCVLLSFSELIHVGLAGGGEEETAHIGSANYTSHDEYGLPSWADNDTEKCWFAFALIAVFAAAGTLFEFLDHALIHWLSRDIKQHEVHFKLSHDFSASLQKSFHTEVTVVGILAFCVWCTNKTNGFDRCVSRIYIYR